MLSANKEVASKLKPSQVRQLLDPKHHTGDAAERCRILVKESINPVLSRHKKRVGIKGKVEY
jgi:hypothetical protein